MMLSAVAMFFVLGFTAGLCTFKVKRRWCPRCGELTWTGAIEHRPAPTPTSTRR